MRACVLLARLERTPPSCPPVSLLHAPQAALMLSRVYRPPSAPGRIRSTVTAWPGASGSSSWSSGTEQRQHSTMPAAGHPSRSTR